MRLKGVNPKKYIFHKFTSIPLIIMLVIILLFSLTTLSGCGKDCVYENIKYYEKIPLTSMEFDYNLVEYNYTAPVVKTTCNNRIEKYPNFLVDYGKKEWLFNTTTIGMSNTIRREIKIFNKLSTISRVKIDKIYLIKGKEYERSTNPMYFNIDPASSRKLYVIWNTVYNPNSDVTIEILNQQSKIITNCTNTTTYSNKVGTRKVPTSTKTITGYSTVFKTRKEKICDY